MLSKIGSVTVFLAFYDLAFVIHTNPKLVPDTAFSIPLLDDSGSGDIKHVGRLFFVHFRAWQQECIVCMHDYRQET